MKYKYRQAATEAKEKKNLKPYKEMCCLKKNTTITLFAGAAVHLVVSLIIAMVASKLLWCR